MNLIKHPISLLFWLSLLTACHQQTTKPDVNAQSEREAVIALLEKHLTAVSNKDLTTLAETLPPDGKMQLILPASEIIETTAGFMQFHETWFKHPNWTFETEILNVTVSSDLAMAVVQSMYREPLRDDKPYFNRMIISYDLKKVAGKWYVLKDHASSVEKSTDS